MNKLILTGYLAKDIDVYGDGVATIIVAPAERRSKDKDGNEIVNFIPVKLFKNLYKNVAPYLVKGKLITVEGRIVTNNFTDKNGEVRYEIDHIGDSIQLLSGQKKEEEAVKAPAKKATKKSAK